MTCTKRNLDTRSWIRLVEVLQAVADVVGRHTNYGIAICVKTGVAAEKFNSEDALLERTIVASEGSLNDCLEKQPAALTPPELLTFEDLGQGGFNFRLHLRVGQGTEINELRGVQGYLVWDNELPDYSRVAAPDGALRRL